MEKSVVLIDAENVLKSWDRYCKRRGIRERIDYVKLINKLSENTNLLRAYFYDGLPDVLPSRKKGFLDALSRSGIQLRTKILRSRPYICQNCGSKEERLVQKGVDVSLATDILRHAWQRTCDVCIIVSGDEDYKDAIDVAKDKGVKVWVASFRHNLAKEVELSADNVIFIDHIFDDVKQKI